MDMVDQTADVLLITGDDEFRRLVAKHRPIGARLQCRVVSESASDLGGALQAWIDLDEGPPRHVPDGISRVYFHSRNDLCADDLPPGMFVRKPCNERLLNILWADAVTSRGSRLAAPVPAPDLRLPVWLLDFQELDLKTLCRKYVTALGPQLGYSDASLYLHDPKQGLLVLAETTHSRAIDLTVQTTAATSHMMAAVTRSGRMISTDDAAGELTASGIVRPDGRPYADGACLIMPLISDGILWGVLNLSGRLKPPAPVDDLPLDEIAKFLSRALHNACAFDRARAEARIDGLTGLYNQRWISEALDSEIHRAERFDASLSVMLVDLDGLKDINDRSGHAAGDCALRHVASRIAAVLRQFDGAARVGGDEFVVMLPATDIGGALHVAERLANSVRDDTACLKGVPVPVTVSIGIAEWCSGWDARQLLDAADDRMYRAKKRGRADRRQVGSGSGAVRLGSPPMAGGDAAAWAGRVVQTPPASPVGGSATDGSAASDREESESAFRPAPTRRG